MNRHCSACRFFEGLGAAGVGQCRRHAPAPAPFALLPFSPGVDAMRQRWPVVQASEWCGEWEKKEAGRADTGERLDQDGRRVGLPLAAPPGAPADAQERE